jgi:hypothetical protein
MTELPQPGGFQDLLNEELPETTALDATAVQIWGFLTKGARQADAACQEFEQVVKEFRAEREDLHEDMQLLHADRVDPRSIDAMVEESIASQLRLINSNVMGVVSTLALISEVQQSSAARLAKLTAARQSHFDELHDTLNKQHAMLMKLATSNNVRDALLAKHSERINRMEILFDRLDLQLPNLACCVEVCSEVGSSTTEIASTLTTIRDQRTTTAQRVTQLLNDMEETIQDTFVDLKVDVLTSTLASLEHNIVTRFIAVDMPLANMVPPTHTAGASDRPPPQDHSTAPPAVPAPPDVDTEPPGSASPTSNKDAHPPNRFQANTTFRPGSTFPAGNQVSHTTEANHPDGDFDHGTGRAQNREDMGIPNTSCPGSALPANGLSHYGNGQLSRVQTHRQPWGDDDDGTSPTPNRHTRPTGRQGMRVKHTTKY